MNEIELREHPTRTFPCALSEVFGFRNGDGKMKSASEYYHVDESKATTRELGELDIKFLNYRIDVASDVVSHIVKFWEQAYAMGDIGVATAKWITKGFDNFYDLDGIRGRFGNSGPSRYKRMAWESMTSKTRFDDQRDIFENIPLSMLDVEVPYVDSYDGEREVEKYSIPLDFLGICIGDDAKFMELFKWQEIHANYSTLFCNRDFEFEKRVMDILASHPDVLGEIRKTADADKEKE